MSESAEAPWLPGRLHIAHRTVSTEPLATWWVDFDQVISDWKQTRYYVDARDVTPDGYPHHPLRLLGDAFPRLRALLEVTPVFALGTDPRAIRTPGARIYSVGYARNADDFFSATARGPAIDRRLDGPFHDIAAALGRHDLNPDARETLIDRILDGITDGRLSRRGLDLAETWSALAGGPSMFLLDGASERREYLRALEDGLEEVFTRAGQHLGEYEDMLAALRAADAAGVDRVELPGLGPGWRATSPAVTIAGPRTRPAGELGLVVDCDGESTLALPERRAWALHRPCAPFEPPAIRAWRAGGAERSRRYNARQRDDDVRRRRRALAILGGLMLILAGTCIYQFRKGEGGDSCLEGSDCRSGHCRKGVGEHGECLTLCGRGGYCGPGRMCRYDPELEERFCEPR